MAKSRKTGSKVSDIRAKSEEDFGSWASSNAQPLIVGVVATAATIVVYNYLTKDDDFDDDDDNSFTSQINSLLR